ncbi:unnamed protein product, partial [Strongylus vulgaris]
MKVFFEYRYRNHSQTDKLPGREKVLIASGMNVKAIELYNIYGIATSEAFPIYSPPLPNVSDWLIRSTRWREMPVWTFKQRFPDLVLLKNLDFGALLVDSCSSGKQAIETVVRAETQCFRFNQAGRNITIVPGSVFGYVSGLHGDSQEALKGYFSSGDAAAAL